jgi:hypothetical protein
MHRWALRSLAAHMDKLVAEGVAKSGHEGYTLVQSSGATR